MNLFRRANSIVGWLCFLIASLTYLLTIEPTTSLWDCGEFIATAFKLEVGHPPGNPIFLLIARFFTLFAFGNTDIVPVTVNIMSALCSSFTILILFWTITHLARKLVIRDESEVSPAKVIVVLGAGAIGALAYTFSDTFWFSAVEGEVYAMSSLCTALTFWAIIKWEDRVGQPYANRWLILIAYLIGISIGVHLLNLLAIPAIGLVYYFRLYKPTTWGTLLALMTSCLILLGIMILIPAIPTATSWFELLLVNSLGAPYNTGTVIGFLFIVAAMFFACFITQKYKKRLLNTISLFVTVIVIGFSAFALNIIRADANPPINENAPDNVFSFISYLNRDQYGSPPLIYGRTYATNGSYERTGTTFVKENGKYKKYNTLEAVYDKKNNMLFPRMHSQSSFDEYAKWVNLKKNGGQELAMPTQAENMEFLFGYQLNWMYMRYFFWNFAGRQNDIQGHGSWTYGNWISGIPSLDKLRVPTIENEPAFLQNNKAKNAYYLIPFLLGFIGLAYQLLFHKKQFLVVALLFFLTGIAIVLYLNQTPLQPRERDYAYAGSFYAYAIWIGLAVVAFYELFSKVGKMQQLAAASFATLLCVPAPLLMAQQNWNDHDRSNRYMARDIAYNYLMSCDKNAILFTVGDNDTFPLWYLQEVEGVRTDVRVANLSLLAADWYIDQMKYRTYESAPLPISLPKAMYVADENNSVVVYEQLKGYFDIEQVMRFVSDPANKVEVARGEKMTYIPVKGLSIPVDKSKVVQNELVSKSYADSVVDTIYFKLPKDYLIKPQLVMLDIIANNKWERPIHFTSTYGESNIGLGSYLQYNGFTYKLTPIRNSNNEERIDSEWLYSYLMNTCKWGNMDNEKVYVDHFFLNTLNNILNIRGMHAKLANQLISEGKAEQAKQVVDRVMLIMPEANFPYCTGSFSSDMSIVDIADAMYLLEEVDRANKLTEKLIGKLDENLAYFSLFGFDTTETKVTLYTLQKLMVVADKNGNKEAAKKIMGLFNQYGIS